MNALRLFTTVCLIMCLGYLTEAHAEVVLVENINDSGPGSLRTAVASASDNDTILINVRGNIVLDSPINFIGFSNLTVLGPYPKHNTISPSLSCSGSLFNISACDDVKFQGLGFVGGNGSTRHVLISSSSGTITFFKCLFKDNDVGAMNGTVCVDNSLADFNSCSFIDNVASIAGAIAFKSSATSTISNCTFAGNHATNRAGAIQLSSGSEVNSWYNTYFENSANNLPQAIRVLGPSTLNMEFNAIADNGTGQQIDAVSGSSAIFSTGGNRINLNFIGEPTDLPALVPGDYFASVLFTIGLRSTVKTDGFGLMYYPIVDEGSSFINPLPSTVNTPDKDCRNAPRALKGPDANAYPDAGASEYTQLRVTNDSGDKSDANSFLWTLEAVRRTDPINYIEFDISAPTDIYFEDQGDVSSDAYIIDGFSQSGSAIPGPHEVGMTGLTRAILTIDFVNGGSHGHGIRFNGGTENSILQGVSVQDFSNHAVETNAEDIMIFGCEVGLDDAGDENGTRSAGIRINSGNTTVGGWEHWMRNVVSGNGLVGGERSNININSGNDNRIVGNIIGGSANGMGTISGSLTDHGIRNNTINNQIGSSLVNGGNIIINNQNGIYHTRFGDFTNIQGNNIGIGWDDLTAIGNSIAGISLNGSDDNLIGGYTVEDGNIIAHNESGITLRSESTIAERNRILANSIYSNDQQGIDIGGDGTILPNDNALNGSQQNMGIDFPIVVSAENCEGVETVTTFELSVPTGEEYRVEFFSSTSPDDPNGEGEIFRGVTNVIPTTNPESFTFGHGLLIPSGQSLSATVTQVSTGNTSEFGQNVLVAAPVGDASFEYADICPGDTAKVTYLGDEGGEFRFPLPAPVGVTLNPTTGDMTGGIEGTTYDIIYGFSGTCDVEDTMSFTVITVLEDFTFADFCIEGDSSSTIPVIDIGADPDSVFFSLVGAADGETINLNTGVIYDPVEGNTYTVVDSARNLGCWQSDTVIVTPLNVDESFTMADFCADIESAPAVPETLGGTYSFDPLPGDGADIDTGTGAITDGVEGNSYMVKYEVGTCGEEYILEVFTHVADESFVFDDFCPGDDGLPSMVMIPGGFSFLTPPGDGAMINPGTGIITMGQEGATYTVLHTVGVCLDSDTVETNVIEVLEEFTFADFCIDGDSSSTAPVIEIGADPDSVFFKLVGAADGETINLNTGVIYNPQEGSTYTVVDSARNEGCWQSYTVTVSPLNVDESFTMADFCAVVESAAPVSETPGGTYSFDPLPGDGATIDSGTGAITGGVEGNSYMVVYEVGSCGEKDTLEVFTHVADESFLYPEFCPGEPGMPTDFDISGGFSFLSAPADGAIINPGTGFITMGDEGVTYTVIHTVGVCLDKDTVETQRIEVLEDFTFPDFCILADSSATGPINDVGANPDSVFFKFLGSYDPTFINLNSGIIYSPFEGDSYTVIDSVRNNGCWQSDTTIVMAIEVNEAFSMADFCVGDTGIAVVELALLDTFYFDPDPLDGAYLHPYTGELTLGEGGTIYHVWRIVFDGACTDTAERLVTVYEANAEFTVMDFCPDGPGSTPVPTYDEDGIWGFGSPPLYGETMDSDGIIYGGLEDSTYYITHEVGSGLAGCIDIDTLPVHVFKVNEGFSHEHFCWNAGSEDAVPEELTGLSLFTFGYPLPTDLATIDLSTGMISNASEDSLYEVVHTYISPDGCEQADSLVIAAIGVDESFTFSDFCPGGPSPAPVATTPDGTYEFAPDPGHGEFLDADGIIYNALEDSTYTLRYTVESDSGECFESSEVTVSVIGIDEGFIFNNFCAEFSGFPESTASPDGEFFFDPDPMDGAEIDETTGQITAAVPGTTYPVIYIVGSCMERDTIMVEALESEIAEFTLDDHCANIELAADITGTTGGDFKFFPLPGDDAEINTDNGIITNSNGGDYSVVYYTEGTASACADTIVKNVTIHVVPEITDLNSTIDIYCPYNELTAITSVSTDASKIYWYLDNLDGAPVDSTFDYTPESLAYGDNVFYAQPISEQGCLGNIESYTLILSDTSGMRAIPDFEICLGSPAALLAFGGTNYKWTTTVPMSDITSPNPIVFSLTEEIYIVSIFNDDGCEVVDSIHVTFSPRDECNIEVFNAFSPNNDGKNDFWYIDNLINYTPNTVYIYNRWGDEIREIKDYDNINVYWDGTDKNGNELAPNTYFYVVVTEDAAQNQAGWVQIVR